MSDYRKQAADAALALAERIRSHVDVAATLDAAGADVGALVASAEAAVGAALGATSTLVDRAAYVALVESRKGTFGPHRFMPVSGRTEYLPSTRRDICGAVPVHRTMGRGTEADHYPLLDGAPVGCPESLESHRAEARAAAVEAAWAESNARAAAGQALTRSQRRNRARADRRAAR